MNVEIIDYERQDAGAAFARSLHETGFAVLLSHPIPEPLIKTIYQEWLAFFDSDAKNKYPFTPVGQDGYFAAPDCSSRGDGRPRYDNKEFFHLYPWGQIPREVSDAATRYRLIAMEVGGTLLDWLDRNTPPEVARRFSMPLAGMLQGGEKNALLRILRYPPLPADEAGDELRADVHQDTNLLTLLPAATAPGLQGQDLGGEWHDLPSESGYLTVNAGVMLELASGGYYPSTTHRVVAPVGEAASRSRLSVPLFLHPADNVILHGNVTAAAFLAERRRAHAVQAAGQPAGR
jgi:isopenicillin N synthase-like dioxygenase